MLKSGVLLSSHIEGSINDNGSDDCGNDDSDHEGGHDDDNVNHTGSLTPTRP